MLNQIKIYLLNSKVIILILSFGLFLLTYAVLVILHKKIKKTKFYDIVFINKLVDSLDGWIFFIVFNLYLLYIFSFIFIYPKFFKVLVIVLILILGFVVSKFLGRILQYYASNIDKTISTSLIINLVRIVFWIILLLLVLDYLGITVIPVLTSLGIAGLVLGLALQSTLSNLFAGIQIISNKQIKIGDYIQLENGLAGYVEDIKWHSTIIKELSNNILIVPNSVITTKIVRNYYSPSPDFTFILKISVSYDSDLEMIEEITTKTAKEVINKLNLKVDDFEPFIRYFSFGEYSIDFNLILKVNQYNTKDLLIHELIKELHREYKKNNITIPYSKIYYFQFPSK
jgi:small-conductance mechanosensitive channel